MLFCSRALFTLAVGGRKAFGKIKYQTEDSINNLLAQITGENSEQL